MIIILIVGLFCYIESIKGKLVAAPDSKYHNSYILIRNKATRKLLDSTNSILLTRTPSDSTNQKWQHLILSDNSTSKSWLKSLKHRFEFRL